MSEQIEVPRYRPCPWHVVALLAAAECLLMLSAQNIWFPFNHYKGWTALVAVACVGVALFVLLIWLVAGLCLGVRFQFTLRTLLLLVLVVTVPCSWLALEIDRAKRQRAAIDTIKKVANLSTRHIGMWDGTAPAWLRGHLSDDFFDSVCEADFSVSGDGEAVNLDCLEGWPYVGRLTIGGNRIGDASLKPLRKWKVLQILHIHDASITDDGLENIEFLPGLRHLQLNHWSFANFDLAL